MNNPQIIKRYSRRDNFKDNSVSLKAGMCITGRINDDNEIIHDGSGHSLPYADFAYIVEKITDKEIFLTDLSHNNHWTISPADLEMCELVSEFHECNHSVECEDINRVLSEKE